MKCSIKLKETFWFLCPSEGCWSWVKGDWATSSQWQSHLAPPSLGHPHPGWIQPVAHSHTLRLVYSLSSPFSNPNGCRVCQSSALLLGQGAQKSSLPPAALSHWFLIAQSSGQLPSGSLQPDVWANHPQQSFPTALQVRHTWARVCSGDTGNWLWTYDPNYFWFPAWMILSASGLSLSNLRHSKFPHSVLK